MWADKEESDEEEERPSFGRKRPNYTAPVNFVSGGVKHGSRIEKDEEGAPDKDDDEERIDLKPFFDRKKTKKDGASKKPQMFAGMRGPNAFSQGSDPNEYATSFTFGVIPLFATHYIASLCCFLPSFLCALFENIKNMRPLSCFIC